MNIFIKKFCLALSVCITSVGVMQPGELKRAKSMSDQHDNPFLSPATSLLCLSKFSSLEDRGSIHSIDSTASGEEFSDSEPKEKCWHQVVCVEIPDDENEQLVNALRKTSPRGVIIRTEDAISSFNTRTQRTLETPPVKPFSLRRLLCCCCCK